MFNTTELIYINRNLFNTVFKTFVSTLPESFGSKGAYEAIQFIASLYVVRPIIHTGRKWIPAALFFANSESVAIIVRRRLAAFGPITKVWKTGLPGLRHSVVPLAGPIPTKLAPFYEFFLGPLR